MKRPERYTSGLVLALIVLALGLSAPAWAAVFTVNSTADEPDEFPGDGRCQTSGLHCTLRAAIEEANALAGDDVIVLPPGFYALSLGTLVITENLGITGDSIDHTTIRGSDKFGAIHVQRGIVSISFLTIYAGERAILNEANLTLSHVKIHLTQTRQVPGGGGILNEGQLYVRNSIFLQNGSLAVDRFDPFVGGGSLYNLETAIITDSTFEENGAVSDPPLHSHGGAIFNAAGALYLFRTTVARNEAHGAGGGIFTLSELHLENSTVSGNVTLGGSTAGEGGGIYVFNTLVEMTNTTITANESRGGGAGGVHVALGGRVSALNTILAHNVGSDCFGNIISVGHNLIENGTDCRIVSGLGPTPTHDIFGVDPLLGPLDENGGPTRTHALLAGSPAIDAAGIFGCPETDQRGFFRPADGDGDGLAVCDIGAYEFGSRDVSGDVADLTLRLAARPFFLGTRIAYTATVTNAGPDDANGVLVEFLLPATFSFLDVTPSQGACAAPSPAVTTVVICELGFLADRGTATVVLEVQVPTAPRPVIRPTFVTMEAVVAAPTPDPDTTNNMAVSRLPVPPIPLFPRPPFRN